MPASKRTSYFYAIFGITLVLIVTGIAAFIGLQAKRISTDFKENLLVEVVLKDSISTSSIQSLQLKIRGKQYCKELKYISKEDAAKMLQKDLGENFIDLLGYNPLYASFLLNVYEPYTDEASFEKVKKELMAYNEVKQVNFQKNVLESLDKNLANFWFVMLIVASVLLAFAVSLIFNTIRLAMFSNRFTIKTMQLFGATRWFIIRPFLGRSIFNGFISGVLACMVLTLFIWWLMYSLPDLGLQRDLVTFGALFGALILFGIIISFFSTLTAVFRYLRMKVEDLY